MLNFGERIPLFFRDRCRLEYLGIKGHDVCNLLSISSPKTYKKYYTNMHGLTFSTHRDHHIGIKYANVKWKKNLF